MVSTDDSSYKAVIRPKITFKSVDGLTTLFTYNAFESSNPINVTYMDVEGAVGESGVFNIIIEDSTGAITEDLHNCKVFIQLGKSEATLHYFMIGYADIFTHDRPVTRYQQYRLTGYGSAIQAAQLYVHRREASKIQNIDDPKVSGDSNFNIDKLVKRALTDARWRPLRDRSIVTETGWATTGISPKVNINYPVVNVPFTYLNDFLDQMCAVSGAVWFIDFTTGSEVFTLSYNTDLHTGVVIKSGDLRVGASDDATKTGYIKRQFNVEDNTTSEAGVATRLYTSTRIDQVSISSSFTNKGSTTLDNRAIAQQVIIDNDSRRINSLAFNLRKIGDPDRDEIRGDIVLDKSNKPTGQVVATFEIPMSSIDDDVRTIFVNDINAKESLLTGGTTKIWLRLFRVKPTADSANTVAWHHSGVFNASPVLGTYSATGPEGGRDVKDSIVWNATNLGPTYTYAIFSDIRRLISRTNQQAANTLRMREVFVPTDFITDTNTAAKYLSLNLAEMSKARRSIPDYQVTVPNNFIYKPYQWVSFNDGLSGISQDLQVKRARYVIGSSAQDAQIGTLHAEISLGGSYNSLLTNCSCL